MIVLASRFMATRSAARWYRGWRFQAEDFFILLAYAFFLSMSIRYVAIIPSLYRVAVVSEGIIPPYPAVLKDSLSIIKVFFTDSRLLFFTLWSVKFSMLFLYRRLMVGLPKHLRRWVGCICFLCGGKFDSNKQRTRTNLPHVQILRSTVDFDRCRRLQFHILQQHAHLVYTRSVHFFCSSFCAMHIVTLPTTTGLCTTH